MQVLRGTLKSTSSFGSLMACGTSSSGRVRSELRSWRLRTGSWSWRTPGASTLAPRSSNAIDLAVYASQLAPRRYEPRICGTVDIAETAAYGHEVDFGAADQLAEQVN